MPRAGRKTKRSLPTKLREGDPRYVRQCTRRRGFLCRLLVQEQPRDRRPYAYACRLTEARAGDLRNVLCPHFDTCLDEAAKHDTGTSKYPPIQDMYTWVCGDHCPYRNARASPFQTEEQVGMLYRKNWPVPPPTATEDFKIFEFRAELTEKEDPAWLEKQGYKRGRRARRRPTPAPTRQKKENHDG